MSHGAACQPLWLGWFAGRTHKRKTISSGCSFVIAKYIVDFFIYAATTYVTARNRKYKKCLTHDVEQRQDEQQVVEYPVHPLSGEGPYWCPVADKAGEADHKDEEALGDELKGRDLEKGRKPFLWGNEPVSYFAFTPSSSFSPVGAESLPVEFTR